MVPKRSIWEIGLSVNRPRRAAVGSPKPKSNPAMGNLMKNDRRQDRKSPNHNFSNGFFQGLLEATAY